MVVAFVGALGYPSKLAWATREMYMLGMSRSCSREAKFADQQRIARKGDNGSKEMAGVLSSAYKVCELNRHLL